MFGIDLDRFQDQVQFIGAVDFPKHTVDMVWRDDLGFGEVIEAIDPVGMQVFHDENRALAAFVPREQRQVVGAEVKHERWLPVAREKRVWVNKERRGKKERERISLAPSAAPMRS